MVDVAKQSGQADQDSTYLENIHLVCLSFVCQCGVGIEGYHSYLPAKLFIRIFIFEIAFGIV